jgi:hypothetical protein
VARATAFVFCFYAKQRNLSSFLSLVDFDYLKCYNIRAIRGVKALKNVLAKI